jgi:hypothetical protein
MMASSNLVLSIIAVDKASKTLGGIGKSIGKMSVNTAAVGASLVAFGATSIKAFSDSEAAQLKLNDAFDKFPKLSDTSTASLNKLNAEMQKKTRFDDEAYASAEATLAQYGLTGQQLTDLIPLVADFAAKTGTSVEDASGKIGKALLGQGRALKAVGIDFVDAGSTSANFTQIMGGLRAQVGGFAEKEGQTAAGKAEILKNQFGELQETVGSLLVPALSTLVGAITPVISGFNDLPKPVRDLTFVIGGLATATFLLGPKVVATVKALAAFRTALILTTAMTRAFNVSLIAALAPLALVAAAATALIAVVGLVGSSMVSQAKIVDDSAEAWRLFSEAASPQALKDLRKELTPAQKAVVDWTEKTSFADGVSDSWNRGVNTLSSAFRNSNTVLEQGAEDTRKMNQAQTDLQTVIDNVSRTTGKSKDEVKMLADTYKVDLTKGVGEATYALSQKVTATDKDKVAATKAALANGGLVTETDRLKSVADKTRTKIDELRNAINILNGKTIDLGDAQDNSIGALNRANEAIKANGGSLKGNSDKAIDARKSVRDFIRAKQDEAIALDISTGKVGAGNKVIDDAKKKVKELGDKYKIPQTELNKYLDALKKTPSKKKTTIQVAVTGLNADERELLALYKTLPTSTQVGLALGVPIAGARAMGGPVKANTPYLVGERRPEVFVPSTNGKILPRVPSDTGAIMTTQGATAGGSSIIIQGGTFIGASKQDTARWMSEIIREGKSRGLVMS